MIYIPHNTRIVVVRGARTMIDVEAEILKVTGGKRVKWRDWTIVGLADDDSKGITTGMPFSPPDAERESPGFKYGKVAKKRR